MLSPAPARAAPGADDPRDDEAGWSSVPTTGGARPNIATRVAGAAADLCATLWIGALALGSRLSLPRPRGR